MSADHNTARKPLMGYNDVIVQDESMCWSCTRGWLKTFLIFFNIMILYGWILTVLLLLQLATGILAFLFSRVFENWLAYRMQTTMQTEYTDSTTSVDKAVDEVQQRFKCCGSHSFRDWSDSAFQNSTKTGDPPVELLGYSMRVPDSCCIRVGENCGYLPHPSNVFHQGCMPTIFVKLRERYYIICVVALALISVEIFGIVFSCCYSQAQKKR